jgi:drug/metabolite transporter (DMT)-like permease
MAATPAKPVSSAHGASLSGNRKPVIHMWLTEGYRFAPASVLAPFEYTAMVGAGVLGYVMFGEMPTSAVLLGAVIIAASGLFVIWREHLLDLERLLVRVRARTARWGDQVIVRAP